MKKALVVLLILAVAGGMFAQINFTGNVRGGIGIALTDADNSDPEFLNYMFGDGLRTRFELTGTWAHADGNAGGRVLLRGYFHGAYDAFASAANMNTDSLISIVNAEAWFKAMDGMITIYGGNIDQEGPFGTGGGIAENFGMNGGHGMFINVAPMAGLDIRAVVSPNNFTANTYGNLFENARYNFGFAYTMPDLLTVVGILRQSNGGVYDMTDVALGFKILALRSMGLSTLNIDVAILDLQKSAAAKFMTVQIGQRLEYVSGDLTIGGRFMQQLRLYDDTTAAPKPATYTPDLSFVVWLQYVMGNIVPRLDAGFNMGTAMSADYRGNWNGVAKNGFTEDRMNLPIMPSVAFRFGSANHYLKLGYTFKTDMSNYTTNPAVMMRNNIFVDYRVNF